MRPLITSLASWFIMHMMTGAIPGWMCQSDSLYHTTIFPKRSIIFQFDNETSKSIIWLTNEDTAERNMFLLKHSAITTCGKYVLHFCTFALIDTMYHCFELNSKRLIIGSTGILLTQATSFSLHIRPNHINTACTWFCNYGSTLTTDINQVMVLLKMSLLNMNNWPSHCWVYCITWCSLCTGSYSTQKRDWDTYFFTLLVLR